MPESERPRRLLSATTTTPPSDLNSNIPEDGRNAHPRISLGVPYVKCILGEIVIDERIQNADSTYDTLAALTVRNLFVTFWWFLERVMKKKNPLNF